MIHKTENSMGNLPKECKDCPVGIFTEWQMRALKVERELRRHQITDRETRIAEVIVKKSLGWGQPAIAIPQLKFFTNLTGITVPHVHEAIKNLHLKRIIRVMTVRGQATYVIREDTEQWKCPPRVALETIHETMSLLRELNGLPPCEWETLESFSHCVDAGSRRKIPKSVITPVIPKSETLPHLS